MPIVGVEPGLKPAARRTRSGKVGVLATERTLSGAKFLQLRDQIGEAPARSSCCSPAAAWSTRIERRRRRPWPCCTATSTPLLDAGADTLVLGCTHYPLVQASIEQVAAQAGFRDVTLVDTGEAVARQLVRLLQAGGLQRVPDPAMPSQLEAYTSASATALAAAFDVLLGIDPPVHEASFDGA
jgi:glutamate racemase